MKIDTDSKEMRWILLKFLKDSLDFLSTDVAKGFQRGKWADVWVAMCLREDNIKEWMPEDDSND